MSEELRPASWLKALLNEHPALLITVVFVVASAIGMFYFRRSITPRSGSGS